MLRVFRQIIFYILTSVLFLVANLVVTYGQVQLTDVEYTDFDHSDRSPVSSVQPILLESFKYNVLELNSLTAGGASLDSRYFLKALVPISDEILLSRTSITSAAFSGLMEPYFYPSPFRLSEGSTLGYELPENMDIEVRIYTMAGHQIFKDFYAAGTMGGLGHANHTNYNKISFDRDSFGGDELPAGIYFYILIHNGDVVAKGKFAVRPG